MAGKLHVGSLAPEVTEDMLYRLFSKYGHCWVKVEQYILQRYAYIQFVKHEDAKRALTSLNNNILKGRPMRIKLTEPDSELQRFEKAKIFIKNLPDSVTDEDLENIYCKLGEILAWKVAIDDSGHSMCYGFVQFKAEEDAELAIQRTNGKKLRGKEIFVAKYKAREDRMKEKELDFTNVFVKNFEEELDDDGLKKIFEEYGYITSHKVERYADGRSKGYGFVNFANSESARQAVAETNGRKLLCEDGTTLALYVGRAQTKAEREATLKNKPAEKKTEGCNLYVKNLHESVNSARLKQMFDKFGKITSAKVMVDDEGESRCFGFVCFSTLEEAGEAIAKMHGEKFALKTLYVTFAQKADDRKSQLQQQFAQRKPERKPLVVKSQVGNTNQAYGYRAVTSQARQSHVIPNLNSRAPYAGCPLFSQSTRDDNYYAHPAFQIGKTVTAAPKPSGRTGQSNKNPKKGKPSGSKNGLGTKPKRREPEESSFTPIDNRSLRKPAK